MVGQQGVRGPSSVDLLLGTRRFGLQRLVSSNVWGSYVEFDRCLALLLLGREASRCVRVRLIKNQSQAPAWVCNAEWDCWEGAQDGE